MNVTYTLNEHGESVKTTTYPDGTVVSELDIPFVPPPITERFISGVEFLRRFTSAQRIAIRTLTKTDPVADDFMRLLDATIAQGSGVNLMDQDTIDGVGYLAVTIPAAAIDPAVILA